MDNWRLLTMWTVIAVVVAGTTVWWVTRNTDPECFPYCDMGCPSGVEVCSFHPGSSPIISAEGKQCFSGYQKGFVYKGLAAEVLAQTINVNYPREWTLTFRHNAKILVDPSKTYCNSVDSLGNQTAFIDQSTFLKNSTITIAIPDTEIRCMLLFEDSKDGVLYSEHFASNPTTPCLGWVECGEE